MKRPSLPLHTWWTRIPTTWAVVVLLIGITLIHYLTPQTRLLPSPVNAFLNRHAVERILYILPVAVAALSFRQRGALAILIVSVLLMLPRAIWISPSPTDALLETASTAVV